MTLFKLRTLLIVLTLGPPLLWGTFWLWLWAIEHSAAEGEIIYEQWIEYLDGTKTRLPPSKNS